MMEKTRERSEIGKQYQWQLEKMFPSDEAWEQEFKATKSKLPSVEAFQGTLSRSAEQLLGFLQATEAVERKLASLYNYAHMRNDSDSRVPLYQTMRDRAQSLYADFSSAASFFVPEILKMDAAQLDKMLSANAAIAHYRVYFEDVLRSKPHTLTEAEERIIAMTGDMGSGPHDGFSALHDADQVFTPVKDGQGLEHEVSHAKYYNSLQHPERPFRHAWLASYFNSYGDLKHTYASLLAAQVKRHIFLQKVHNYKSCLEQALHGPNIPELVYRTLVQSVNENLAPLHKAINLRKRMLKFKDGVHFYDLYVPLTQGNVHKYSYNDGVNLIRTALAPLGETYGKIAEEGLSLEAGWVDVYPNKGKRSGAYSSGCYDSLPYMLMNYQDNFEDVSTLAHELGHSIHSYLSNKHQSHTYHNYDIFCAEVASTINEVILINHQIDRAKTAAEKLYFLDHYIGDIIKTFYYQTMYSEFELAIHDRMEAGEALSHEDMSTLWGDNLKRYFGEDFILDDNVKQGWMRIPHFYYNFYVYKYATSFAASHVLYDALKREPATTQERIMSFLKAGASKYPMDILKDAGVDMASPAPILAISRKLADLLTQFEGIAKQEGLL